MVIRKTEGIREWHDSLGMFLTRSKGDAIGRKMDSTEQFWDRMVKEDAARITYMTPPRSSALLKRSPTTAYSPTPTSNFLPSSPFPDRSTDEDSGLESMKTNTSDSGSSSPHASGSALLSGVI